METRSSSPTFLISNEPSNSKKYPWEDLQKMNFPTLLRRVALWVSLYRRVTQKGHTAHKGRTTPKCKKIPLFLQIFLLLSLQDGGKELLRYLIVKMI
jgi:hypothetical protein